MTNLFFSGSSLSVIFRGWQERSGMICDFCQLV